jgi:molecular chaperone Hsp33
MGSSDSDASGSSQVPEVDVEVNDPNDKFAIYRNRNNIRDQVFSAISGDGGIKVTAVTARNLLNDMMMKHTLTEVPTEALGRTMICALLMSNGIQDEQNVQITMQGMYRNINRMSRCIMS